MQLAYKRVIGADQLKDFAEAFDRSYRAAGRPVGMAMWVQRETGSGSVTIACRIPSELDLHWQFQESWALGPVSGDGWECEAGDCGAATELHTVDAFDLVR